MSEFIKKEFEYWVRMQWLKTINKEIDKRNKYYERYKKSVCVISELVKEYEKKYGKREDTE
jgi:hypothetical protein